MHCIQRLCFLIFCTLLCGCNSIHSDPNETVAGWWYDTAPIDFETANNPYHVDDQTMCQRYGRCTNSKGPGGGSKVSAQRASGRSSSSGWSQARK